MRTIALAVSTYNHPKYLKGFVESFEQYTEHSDSLDLSLQIHSDDPRYKIEDYLPETLKFAWTAIEDGQNILFGARRNRMIDETLATNPDYVLLFDDDMRFIKENWLLYAINQMDAYKEVGIMGLHWARLKDGKTRQAHHAPVNTVYALGADPIHIKRVAPGNSWICRPEALRQTGHFITAKTREEWKAQSPGPDTEYHNRMLAKTDFWLAATVDDLVWHSGLDEMR